MKFTVENMIATVKSAPEEDYQKLFESFRMMRFYGFIDGETFDAFCEAWNNEKLYEAAQPMEKIRRKVAVQDGLEWYERALYRRGEKLFVKLHNKMTEVEVVHSWSPYYRTI